MRDSCFDCTRKHLAQAAVLNLEYRTGDYPVHKWYAVGHLAEAADEIIKEYPAIAATIRDMRIAYMEEDTDFNVSSVIELISSMGSQIEEVENALD